MRGRQQRLTKKFTKLASALEGTGHEIALEQAFKLGWEARTAEVRRLRYLLNEAVETWAEFQPARHTRAGGVYLRMKREAKDGE